MTATVEIPAPEPTIERPEGQPGQLDDLAAGIHRASLKFEEVADEAAQLRNLKSFTGRAYDAYQSASGTASSEHSRLRSTLERVGHAVDAHAQALREHLRRHDDLVERRSSLDREREALIADVDAATEVTDAAIAELRRRATELRGRYADLRRDHDALHRRVDADERLLAQAFRAADTTEESLSDDGGTTAAARNAMARAGAPGDGASPEQVNAWWRGLSPDEQQAVVMAYPGILGSAAGLPASARDDANRLLLDEDLAELTMQQQEGTLSELEERMLKNAEDTRTALADADSYTDPLDGHHPGGTLWMYDPAAFDGDGRVAVAVGDLDTADDVAVFTPGITTSMTDTSDYTGQMMNLYESTRYGGDGSGSAATMFWLGYDAPDEFYDPATLSEGRADEGGEALADDVDALQAARADDPAHTTAIGHSYGSTTTSYAGAEHGLDVDTMALIGSPGAGPAGEADDLGVDDVFVGRDSRDEVADLGDQGAFSPTDLGGPMAGLGSDPSSDDFGATRFEAENVDRSEDQTWVEDHSNYLDNDSESLYNIGRIVDGDHDAVNEADHTYDPWNQTETDPEFDRDPTHDVPGRSDTTRDRE